MGKQARTFTTRKGKRVTSTLSDIEAINLCRNLTKNNFAQDLVNQYDRRKKLSSEQLAWTHILANDSKKKEAPKEQIQLDASGILNLFNNVSGKLKYPKIHLSLDEQNIRFNRAGEAARYPGSINISDGGPFGESTFFGRIHMDGNFVPSSACTEKIKEFVIAFAEDPISTASAYGHKTGNCCFCVKKLTDPRSVEVGYGPICAKNYGLPWGFDD